MNPNDTDQLVDGWINYQVSIDINNVVGNEHVRNEILLELRKAIDNCMFLVEGAEVVGIEVEDYTLEESL